MIIYAFLPQHFLYLRPFPQIQGSLRPTFGDSLFSGLCGAGQQLVLVQAEPSGTKDVSDKLLLILTTNSFLKLNTQFDYKYNRLLFRLWPSFSVISNVHLKFSGC
jgi:hypothetical protein